MSEYWTDNGEMGRGSAVEARGEVGKMNGDGKLNGKMTGPSRKREWEETGSKPDGLKFS